MTTAALKLRNSLATLAVASVLIVTAGCSAQDLPLSVAGGGSSGSGSADAAPDADDADNDTDESDSESDDTSEATSEPTLSECILGEWYVDNVSFGALMSSVGHGAVDNVTGVVKLTMGADGSTTTVYDDWKHTITVDTATITIVKNGTDFGTYEVHGDGTVSMIDTKISSDTTSVMNLGGKMISTAVTNPEPSVFSQATFTCSGDELAVTADGGTTILHR